LETRNLKRQRGASKAAACDDGSGTTAPCDVRDFVGLPNPGVMCWFTSLCQALASLRPIMLAISSSVPLAHLTVEGDSQLIVEGDALVEGIQRCCNGRGIRPFGESSAPFPVSTRTNAELADLVITRTHKKAKQEDSIEGLLRSINHPGESPIHNIFCAITASDATWFVAAHSRDCSEYRAPNSPVLGGKVSSTSVFIISPDTVAHARGHDEREFGIASFFSDSSDCGPRTAPFNVLARLLNASLKAPDAVSVCGRCKKHLRIATRRRLDSCPEVVVAAIQRDAQSAFAAAPVLYLHNTGEVLEPDDVRNYAVSAYRLAAVVHYHGPISGRGGHYTARVLRECEGIATWLNCDDGSVTVADGPGSKLSGAGFFYERVELDVEHPDNLPV